MKNSFVKEILKEHIDIIHKDSNQLEKKIKSFSQMILKCFKHKKKILIFGNGGSAADSQHFATELTVRLKKNRIALPALSLTTFKCNYGYIKRF